MGNWGETCVDACLKLVLFGSFSKEVGRKGEGTMMSVVVGEIKRKIT